MYVVSESADVRFQSWANHCNLQRCFARLSVVPKVTSARIEIPAILALAKERQCLFLVSRYFAVNNIAYAEKSRTGLTS